MLGDGSSKSDLEQSDVACDVTLRNLIPSHSRKLKLGKSSPYIVNRVYKTIYKYELDGLTISPSREAGNEETLDESKTQHLSN